MAKHNQNLIIANKQIFRTKHWENWKREKNEGCVLININHKVYMVSKNI